MAVIESMNGARFVHDTLELSGWSVEIADAQKVKGLASLASKIHKIDAKNPKLLLDDDQDRLSSSSTPSASRALRSGSLRDGPARPPLIPGS